MLTNSREEEKTAQEQNMCLLVGQHIRFLQLRTVSQQPKRTNSVRSHRGHSISGTVQQEEIKKILWKQF